MRALELPPLASPNLRWNPLGEAPGAGRDALPVCCLDVDEEAMRLATPGYAIELVPPSGRDEPARRQALHDHFEGRRRGRL